MSLPPGTSLDSGNLGALAGVRHLPSGAYWRTQQGMAFESPGQTTPSHKQRAQMRPQTPEPEWFSRSRAQAATNQVAVQARQRRSRSSVSGGGPRKTCHGAALRKPFSPCAADLAFEGGQVGWTQEAPSKSGSARVYPEPERAQ